MQTNCGRANHLKRRIGVHLLFVLGIVMLTDGSLYAQQPTGLDLKTIQQLKSAPELPTQARRTVKSRVKVSNPKLRDAINAYRTDKNLQAQQMLDELLVDNTLAPSDRGVAEFFMGKVLFKEQLYYSSVPYFQSVVSSQAGTAYYPYSFQRLVWISKKDGMYQLLVDPLRNRKTGLIPRNYRNDVFYIFARAYFEEEAYGKVEQAIKSIQPSSEFYHEGQLMRALIYLRGGKIEEALGTFIEAAKSPDENVKGLAQLGIARIYYERTNDKLALQNYSLVAQSSRHWLTSQMEAAWAHFRSNEPSLALGNVHPFDSEPFSGVFSPEASLIKSTVFFRLCKYSDAEKAVLVFFEKYMPIYRQLEAFNAKYASNPSLYRQEIIKAIFKTKSELPQAMAKEIFSENWFELRIRRLESLKAETDRLTAMQTKYDSESIRLSKRFVNDNMKRVTAELIEAAVPLLKAWEGKLAGFFRQASLLRFESAYATIDFERQKRKTDFIIPNDQQFEVWTFDEEYWRDELGDYRYLLRSECAEDQG